MGAWLKDLTHARRRFSKSPGFMAAVVISIGLASPPTPPSFRWSAGSSCAPPSSAIPLRSYPCRRPNLSG